MPHQLTIISSHPDASSLTVSIDWLSGAVVLRGELDRNTVHHLDDALTALAVTDHDCWVLDTAEVTWCDAGGLRALASAHALAEQHGGELRLVRPSRCVERLVTLIGLDRLIASSEPLVDVVPPVTGPPHRMAG
jgi:anti-sigma B factor antagonist